MKAPKVLSEDAKGVHVPNFVRQWSRRNLPPSQTNKKRKPKLPFDFTYSYYR